MDKHQQNKDVIPTLGLTHYTNDVEENIDRLNKMFNGIMHDIRELDGNEDVCDRDVDGCYSSHSDDISPIQNGFFFDKEEEGECEEREGEDHKGDGTDEDDNLDRCVVEEIIELQKDTILRTGKEMKTHPHRSNRNSTRYGNASYYRMTSVNHENEASGSCENLPMIDDVERKYASRVTSRGYDRKLTASDAGNYQKDKHKDFKHGIASGRNNVVGPIRRNEVSRSDHVQYNNNDIHRHNTIMSPEVESDLGHSGEFKMEKKKLNSVKFDQHKNGNRKARFSCRQHLSALPRTPVGIWEPFAIDQKGCGDSSKTSKSRESVNGDKVPVGNRNITINCFNNCNIFRDKKSQITQKLSMTVKPDLYNKTNLQTLRRKARNSNGNTQTNTIASASSGSVKSADKFQIPNRVSKISEDKRRDNIDCTESENKVAVKGKKLNRIRLDVSRNNVNDGDNDGGRDSSNNNTTGGDDAIDKKDTDEVEQEVDVEKVDDVIGERLEVGSPDFDYDEEIDTTRSNDLSTFDFESLTKPHDPNLTANQIEYKEYCKMFGVLPDGFILRNLVTSELRLCGLSLGRKRIKALCATLLSNSYVTMLEIAEDQIDLQSMQYLIETFTENSMIEQLLLPNNKMGRLPVKLLMEFLCQSDQLTFLSLYGNELVDTDGAVLAGYIGTTHNLHVLDLGNNKLGYHGCEAISKAMAKNTSIETLSLSWNYMGSSSMAVFLECFNRNKTLENLDLSWNGFGEVGTDALAKALRRNDKLTTVDISSCRLTGGQLVVIVDALKKNVALKNLVIGGNVFAARQVHAALSELASVKGMLALKELDMMDTPILLASEVLVQKLMEEKDVMISHGPVIGKHTGQVPDEEALATLNPTTVLIEFGRMLEMSLLDLFEFMDTDGSGTLSREEIKEGLLEFNIPLPERHLDLLIRNLDRDGDGVISYQELVAQEQVSKQGRIADILNPSAGREGGVSDGYGSRCRKILKRLSEKGRTSEGKKNSNNGDRLPSIGDNQKVTG